MSHNDVPMMFRAQVTPRCNVQRIDPKKTKNNQKQDIELWANEWKKALPPSISNSQKEQAPIEDNLPVWKRRPVQVKPQTPWRSPSDFGKGVKTRTYKLAWRLANNSGADPSINRPAFGSQGYPFYTGSSMKGAFRRACTEEQKKRYCGFESKQDMKPSEVGLRFHGGYPADENWREKIIDLVHPQEKKQVTDPTSNRSNAMAQIAFYGCEMNFGISSHKPLTDQEWDEIWSIWEKALSRGLGGRTSAGYGYFEKYSPSETLLTVDLIGQGVASKMLDRKKEFRPNMFKAALRGHTLRLFSGLTTGKKAKQLTEKLWGGFSSKSVGLLAVAFETKKLQFPIPDGNEPTYEVSGQLKVILTNSKIQGKELCQIQAIVQQIIQFTMLFGGFGKSWRRVDHNIFKPDYPKRDQGHQIGCHWKFGKQSSDLYIRLDENGDLQAITEFIDNLRNKLKTWGNIADNDQPESSYREAWYQGKVEVWARVSEGTSPADASVAVGWLHDAKVKQKLGGSTRHTGRIWHRMYPSAVITPDREIKTQFIEFLVIFPDSQYRESYKYLSGKMKHSETLFKKMW